MARKQNRMLEQEEPRELTAREQAQELAWQAADHYGPEPDKATVAELCRQALAIYPDCVDALRMLADVEAFWVRDYVTGLRKAIEAGRRELGEEFFREHKGQFWLMMETRPFMRALGALAEVLGANEYWQAEAIAVHRELLELNPRDHQGIRYGLIGCYLTTKKYWEAEIR